MTSTGLNEGKVQVLSDVYGGFFLLVLGSEAVGSAYLEWPSLLPLPIRDILHSKTVQIPRDPSTFSKDDWRYSYVGLEGPSTF